MKAIFTISGQMKAVTSSHHLLIFVFDKKRRIVCPFQHTGTICSLMHIDVRIKANQAGRHHPYHPPAALPPCSHLFVPVLKHEYQTCPADSPSNAPQWLRVTLSLPLPQRSPFILHTSIGVSCTPRSSAATVVHTGFKINARPSWSEGSAGCRLTNFALNTNTDCSGKGAVCCHSICPRGIRCYISALLFWSLLTSTSCPHPLFLSSLPLSSLSENVCLELMQSPKSERSVGSHL